MIITDLTGLQVNDERFHIHDRTLRVVPQISQIKAPGRCKGSGKR
jgi:hypothetical protein